MTLRLPLELREAVTEEARVKGDLARIVLFALSHVDRKDVEIQQTRKAGLPLCSPQLLHIGAEARTALREWAEEEGVSVNAIVVSVLGRVFQTTQAQQSSSGGTPAGDPGEARIFAGLVGNANTSESGSDCRFRETDRLRRFFRHRLKKNRDLATHPWMIIPVTGGCTWL